MGTAHACVRNTEMNTDIKPFNWYLNTLEHRFVIVVISIGAVAALNTCLRIDACIVVYTGIC